MIFICAALSGSSLLAQKTDTLLAVTVVGKKQIDPAATLTPVQHMNKKSINRLGSNSIAEAVKYFAGVIMKDYGGIGGLKTVSVRSLGANHTGFLYNGVVIGNAQNGQVDLSKFTLDNVEEIRLHNSAPPNILQTARSYSYASVLSVKTSSADNISVESTAIATQVKSGSFGLFNPSAAITKKFNKHFQTGISAEYLRAHGRYFFPSYENNAEKTSRENTDINAGRIEYRAACIKNDSNSTRLNAYYYNSRRGLPGSVILYNAGVSGQRLNDENFFIHLSQQHNISAKGSLLLNAKLSQDNIYYLDPYYPNSAGKYESDFRQKEKYFSAAYRHQLLSKLSVSMSGDIFTNDLRRKDQFAGDFPKPKRTTLLSNIAAQFEINRFSASANLLYTALDEKLKTADAGKDFREFSPAFSISFLPVKNVPLRLRGFYKNTFRAPTFNDLYYTNIGNSNLRPEYVKQYNGGITWSAVQSGIFKNLTFTADGYINTVKDRILAVPRQNLFQWTMLNIGKVNIKGIDLNIVTSLKSPGSVSLSMAITYSYQKALDISDRTTEAYNKQLPYSPEHSAAVMANAEYGKFVFSYNIVSSSYRYRIGAQIAENVVQGWSQHDVVVQYIIGKPDDPRARFNAALNNIFNTRYEIIRFYPMPGFHCRVGITSAFKHQHKKQNK